jgi:hypothetical protein
LGTTATVTGRICKYIHTHTHTQSRSKIDEIRARKGLSEKMERET